METKMNIIFFGKKSKNFKEKGRLPIYMRVTILSRRLELSSGHSVEPSQWLSTGGKVKGNTEEARTINTYLDLLKRRAYDYQQEMMLEGLPFTIEVFKSKWFGTGIERHKLMDVVRQHNAEVKALIGKGYVKATWVKYKTTETHLEAFLKWKYRVKDIDLRSLKYAFIMDLEFFLKTEKNLSINSYGKVIKNVKKIVNTCVARDWLDKDPFARYKVKHIDPQVPYLSADELQRVENKVFAIERLALVKDLFLFSCYTGLAYIDAACLTPDHLVVGVDGKQWINKNRQKTDVSSRIPLLSPALAILEKYKDHPQTSSSGRLLPMMSNQKVNAYLKEIADLCGIKKEVTFHVARHTFATTVTLSNGVPFETVSKMLGHKKLQTTQIYSKVVDIKVGSDMGELETKFANKQKQF
jgi:site-specific recombinase XerD